MAKQGRFMNQRGTLSRNSTAQPPIKPRSPLAAPDPRQPMIPVAPQARRPIPPRTRRNRRIWLLVIPAGMLFALMMLFAGGLILYVVAFSERMLPGVYFGDRALGGLTQAEAIPVIQRESSSLTLRDGSRTWSIDAATLGLQIDAQQTAARAFAQGHGEGGIAALFNRVQIAPVVTADAVQMLAELERIAPSVSISAINAGVAFEQGIVVATAPQNGRVLDVNATVAQLIADPEAALASGELMLTMREVAPAVTDSSALVAQAQALLGSPLDIRVFDPVTGDSVYWSASPQEWGNWLTAIPDPASPIGLALQADAAAVGSFLTQQAAILDASRSIDLEAGVQSVQNALAAGRPQDAYLTITHRERQHTVRAGETITSIAWDYGIPYLYIMQANGGIEAVSVGQTITIPPADLFLQLPIVPDKRIEVSISQQRTRVYENGQLIWDWASSTGIASSPTWTGVYQILSHEPNAYAANWNLYMPNFMGVYQPVPGADFTNGFHGFPTRGGGQLLWENSLGTRVTYGCILLSDYNMELLYNWAEEGVVVEILP
jgi:lipoprotein-anchoring transpeptidase ErfK/SrfK